MTRSSLAARLAIALLVLAAVGFARPSARRALWRTVYPHLPPRVQAAPYRLHSRLIRVPQGPSLLPTAVASQSVAATIPTAVAAAATVSVPTTQESAPTANPPPTATAVNLPMRHELGGLRHEYQTWNNCGPATVSMALSAFGMSEGQAAAARTLKPDPDDKNVSPSELADYVRSRGLEATVRVNGTIDRLRELVALDLPVIVETWFIPHPGDEMGHYRVVTGYDHQAAMLITMDSYNGPLVSVPYDEFDRLWRVFNRVYIVISDRQRSADVAAVLGADSQDAAMLVAGAARAEAELMAAADPFGWFNLGSCLLGLGDPAGAAGAFDRARALGLPWRMLWYQFGPFEAYAAVGRWNDVAALADENLRRVGNLEESLYWRGRARQALGDREGAIRSWRQALAVHPGYEPALQALREVPAQ